MADKKRNEGGEGGEGQDTRDIFEKALDLAPGAGAIGGFIIGGRRGLRKVAKSGQGMPKNLRTWAGNALGGMAAGGAGGVVAAQTNSQSKWRAKRNPRK